MNSAFINLNKAAFRINSLFAFSEDFGASHVGDVVEAGWNGAR